MSGVKCRFGAYYVVGERKTRLAVLHQPLYLAMAQNSLSNCWWPWTPEAYPLSQFSSSAVIKSLKRDRCRGNWNSTARQPHLILMDLSSRTSRV